MVDIVQSELYINVIFSTIIGGMMKKIKTDWPMALKGVALLAVGLFIWYYSDKIADLWQTTALPYLLFGIGSFGVGPGFVFILQGLQLPDRTRQTYRKLKTKSRPRKEQS